MKALTSPCLCCACAPPPQVGQCGNQVGCRFWELALREHAAYNAGGRYDEALSSFFENVDARTLPPTPLPLNSHIRTLKVRMPCCCCSHTCRADETSGRRGRCWWTWRRAS